MRRNLMTVFCLFVASTAFAQGIRGVTRRTPTVVYGQNASQFFAAGGLPLNPVNPGLANVPGASQIAGMGTRGLVSSPVPAIRAGGFPASPTTPIQRPAAATVPEGSTQTGASGAQTGPSPRR